MLVLSLSQVIRVRQRRLRFALYVLQATGQPYPVPHPYIRAQRLCWSTAHATRKTIPANH